MYGLIFLFKYVGHGMDLGDPPGAGLADGGDVFFAQQIINNACATQASATVSLGCEWGNVGMPKAMWMVCEVAGERHNLCILPLTMLTHCSNKRRRNRQHRTNMPFRRRSSTSC